MEFNNINELHERLMPALRSKEKELHIKGYRYIDTLDIWNYLKKYKWSQETGLSLSSMVDDILNIDNDLLDEYKKDIIIKERIETTNEI